MICSKLPAGALALAGLVLMGIGSAQAATLTLSDTTVSTGTTSSGVTSILATPGSYTYADSFSGSVGGTPVTGTTNGFFDDYVFTVSGTTADSVTSTINLGNFLTISGLQVSLFSLVPGQNTIPLFGSTLPPGSTRLDAWSTPITAGGSTLGSISVLPPTLLAAGTYALEIRGTASGTVGGSYTGQLDLAPTPVPLPAALPLLLAGLGGLGGLFRKRLAA